AASKVLHASVPQCRLPSAHGHRLGALKDDEPGRGRGTGSSCDRRVCCGWHVDAITDQPREGLVPMTTPYSTEVLPETISNAIPERRRCAWVISQDINGTRSCECRAQDGAWYCGDHLAALIVKPLPRRPRRRCTQNELLQQIDRFRANLAYCDLLRRSL